MIITDVQVIDATSEKATSSSKRPKAHVDRNGGFCKWKIGGKSKVQHCYCCDNNCY